MRKALYYLHNENFVKEGQPFAGPHNRSYLYGDGLFESMHCHGGRIPLISKHINRLLESMIMLGMSVPEYFTASYFESLAERLFLKNKITGSARIRLHVYRNEGGLYAPDTDEVSFSMTISALDFQKFQSPNQNLNVDLYEGIKKTVGLLSGLKSSNALLFVLAGIFKKHLNLDDCLLMNTNDELVEALSSNLFLVINDELITPGLSSGCVPGLMRQEVLNLAGLLSVKTHIKPVKPSDLTQASEVFLTNAISGIQSVKAYRNKRFFRELAPELSDQLNKRNFS